MSRFRFDRRRAAAVALALSVPAPLPAAPASAAAPAPGDRYVAMGSSFAAGPGIGLPDAASDGCGRSDSNFAREVAERFRLALDDVSCSGATTREILSRRQFGFPPQVEAVDARTRLVTVLIGGNDLSYMGNLFAYSCRDAGGGACGVLPDDAVRQRLASLPDALRAVIAAVRERAPEARILMVAYQPVLPPGDAAPCAGVTLSAADAVRMRAVDAALNRTIRAAAAAARVELVPADAIGAGHDACAPQPFVAGYHPPTTPGWPRPVPYHPNQAAMDRIAAAIEAMLGGERPQPAGVGAGTGADGPASRNASTPRFTGLRPESAARARAEG